MKTDTTFTHAWCSDCMDIVPIEFDRLCIPQRPDFTDATDIMGKECHHIIATTYRSKP
jgi:hypothetical protein